jgi:hypothetical protein
MTVARDGGSRPGRTGCSAGTWVTRARTVMDRLARGDCSSGSTSARSAAANRPGPCSDCMGCRAPAPLDDAREQLSGLTSVACRGTPQRLTRPCGGHIAPFRNLRGLQAFANLASSDVGPAQTGPRPQKRSAGRSPWHLPRLRAGARGPDVVTASFPIFSTRVRCGLLLA